MAPGQCAAFDGLPGPAQASPSSSKTSHPRAQLMTCFAQLSIDAESTWPFASGTGQAGRGDGPHMPERWRIDAQMFTLVAPTVRIPFSSRYGAIHEAHPDSKGTRAS